MHARTSQKRQDPAVTHDLPVALEDIFKGTTKKMKITRRVLNDDGRSTHIEDKVLTIAVRRFRYSIWECIQGIVLVAVDENLSLRVQVKPGWKAGTKVTFPREGDQHPGRVAADIIFIIRDKPHAHFKREGADLRYKCKLPLRDALCGTTVSNERAIGEDNFSSLTTIVP